MGEGPAGEVVENDKEENKLKPWGGGHYMWMITDNI
jgi:hypothetical protein